MPARLASCIFRKHRKFHTLHLSRQGDDMRLACGCALTSSCSRVDTPSTELPRCGVCFGKGLSDADFLIPAEETFAPQE
eukprot:4359008-Amphidinium_carterae.1